jgi:hypothetical protein
VSRNMYRKLLVYRALVLELRRSFAATNQACASLSRRSPPYGAG